MWFPQQQGSVQLIAMYSESQVASLVFYNGDGVFCFKISTASLCSDAGLTHTANKVIHPWLYTGDELDGEESLRVKTTILTKYNLVREYIHVIELLITLYCCMICQWLYVF